MVDYDQACKTEMINISVRIGLLKVINDDVVEETKTLLMIIKEDHLEDLENLVDKSDK